MWRTLSLPGPLWPGEVAPNRVLSMGEIEVNWVLMLNWIAWNKTVLDIETAYLSYLPNPSARAGYDTRSIFFFKRSLTGLNSEFSFSLTSCLTKAEETSLPYYLPIAGGIIIGFIPFPRVLVLCEMLSVSSRIWTRVAVSISYDDNHYTMGTLKLHTYANLNCLK